MVVRQFVVEFVKRFVSDNVFCHVHNVAFGNGFIHTVNIKGSAFFAKVLNGFIAWCGSQGYEAKVWKFLSGNFIQ
ncbi:hypothetical protein SDC9_179991 [bioreactor metagenome]|uniref:Uncharacterized protein n=1 Tax=bioreactor metagenome TaxID=1076179 RepID=A0A645H2F7_9ZZZZ